MTSVAERVLFDPFTENVHPIAAGHEGGPSLLWPDEAGLSRRRRESSDEVLGECLRLGDRFSRFGEDRHPDRSDAR